MSDQVTEIKLAVNQQTYSLLSDMAKEANCTIEEIAEVACWSVIGGWLQEKAETKTDSVPVQDHELSTLSKDDGVIADK